MSLILDALNRADQERTEENHTPNLHASHGPAPETSSPVRRWVIEGVIICLAVGAFAYSQWSGDKTPETAEQITPEVINQPVESQPVKVVPVKPEPVKPTPVAIIPESPTEPPPIEKAAPETKANAAIASLYDQPVVVEPVQEIDNTQFILQQIPLITERSSRLQRSLPSIDYGVHVYSEEDGAGFVKLNGRIQRVGAQIAPGLRLIAILKDSIVLDLNGTQFRLPALNSWVNYN